MDFCDPKFQRVFGRYFLWTFVKTLLMKQVGHKGKTVPFSSTNNPQSKYTPILSIFVCHSSWIFGDSEFSMCFGQIFAWTSIKTKIMELVGLEGPFIFGDPKF
ncbi:hypothetical protein H5410_049497 [Solanum commersonii]|uniref:Uncharacterized protein n=1 Tax=Solanum commersonii TaxID=4109 RepID=A0A9J5WV93_SOLCO|nr:hypothetical protein H5410_049497 [Solanum commersonii]